jgi:hypothetical protein
VGHQQPPQPEEEAEEPFVRREDIELAQLGRLPRRSTKPGRGNYRKVHKGLTLNLAAAAILLGVFILGLIAVLASTQAIYAATEAPPQSGVPSSPRGGLPIGFIFLAALLVIGQGVDLVGLGHCLGAPRKDAARSLAQASLIASAAGLPLACGGGVLLLATSIGAIGGALLILGLLLVCGAKVLYLLFLRALGLAMEMLPMARQVYLIIFLVVLAGLFHLTVLAATSFALTGDILGVVSGLGTGAGLYEVSVTALLLWGASWLILLYALIRFVLTIHDARSEVLYHMARRSEPQ